MRKKRTLLDIKGTEWKNCNAVLTRREKDKCEIMAMDNVLCGKDPEAGKKRYGNKDK